MNSYTVGTLVNIDDSSRGSVTIVAVQENGLFLVSNGDRRWRCTAEQLRSHGWRMAEAPDDGQN